MVRDVLPRVYIYYLALIVSAFQRASSSTPSTVDCTRFDIAELEDYLSKVHPEKLPAIDTMIGKFTSPVTELPFGAFRSDWQRLLLLRGAQPEGSILREKLGRLFRILAVAYFQTVEPSDITEQPIFSTAGSWDASTSESVINFEEDQEEAGKLGSPATDSTETNQISESFTLTSLPDPEEASRVPEIGLTTSDTTVSYDKRFHYFTSPVDSSSITIRSSTFGRNFKIQSLGNQNIEEERRLKNAKNLNNLDSNRNDSNEDSVSNQTGEYTPKLISSTATSGATKRDGARFDSPTNSIDTSVIDVTSSTIDTNTIGWLATRSLASRNSIEDEERLENMKGFNNSALDKNDSGDDSVNNRVDGYTPKVISSAAFGSTKTDGERFGSSTNPIDSSVITVTSSTFDVNRIASSTTQSLASQDSIGEDKRFENFNNFNNTAFKKYDDLADNNIDDDSQLTDQFTTQQQQINTFNVTALPVYTTMISMIARSSMESSTTGATIEEDRSVTNLKSINNSVLGEEDDLVDSRLTTQEHQGTTKFHVTALPVYTTMISTIAMSSEESSTTRAIIGGDESLENLKVVSLKESDPVNKHQGTKMAGVEKETVGFAKDGSSDHFRGAEVATVAAAAAAAVGGFVTGKSSVAGAIVEEDAQPITSPVSESDTPVTPFGSDFSASPIRDYETMNVGLAAAGIKESGSVVPTRTEIAIARGRGDSPLVDNPMNTDDQENTGEYRGSASTSDPEMTDVKTTIEQSRVHTDRIRGNEVPGDGSLGQQPVHRKDGSDSSTRRSIQNFVLDREEIREPSVSRKLKVDSEFSGRIAIPRIVAATTGPPSNRPDPQGDNRSRTGPVRSKKRGSLNTNVEKTFRWFYNAEKGEARDSDQREIRIECSGKGHGHGQSVS